MCLSGYRIYNIRYVDNIVTLATSKEELQNIKTKLNIVSARYEVRLNTMKAKVLTIDKAENNQLEVRNVIGCNISRHFNYSSSHTVANQGGYEEEIRQRLSTARTVSIKITKI